MVKGFCCPQLPQAKCSEVMFSHGHGAGVIPQCEVDGSQIPVRNTVFRVLVEGRHDGLAVGGGEY